MPNAHVQYFLPPEGGSTAQLIDINHALFASKILLIWSVLAGILDLAIGQLQGLESLGRLLAAGAGLLPMIVAGRASGNVKLDRNTYLGFIRRGAGVGLAIVVLAAVIAFNAGPGASPHIQQLYRGLASALFVTPAATYMALGLMRYRHHQERSRGDEDGSFEA